MSDAVAELCAQCRVVLVVAVLSWLNGGLVLGGGWLGLLIAGRIGFLAR